MSMMRIAVAGAGGLACLIAHYIQRETNHHVIFLSRKEQSELINKGFQVSVIDYADVESLKFALRGIDTVISTVTGPNQVELIKAAVAVRVRRFAPAEFEGQPGMRTVNDPLDRSRSAAQSWLSYYSQHIQTTNFICGILYERFQPGGLQRSRIGITSGFSGEGDYLINCRTMDVQVPAYAPDGNPDITICFTSAHDVARFVSKSIDLSVWPAEMRMCGQRMTVKELLMLIERCKGQSLNPRWHTQASLRSELQLAVAQRETARVIRLCALIATSEGQYDFTQPNLNRAFPDIQPVTFEDWFVARWGTQQ